MVDKGEMKQPPRRTPLLAAPTVGAMHSAPEPSLLLDLVVGLRQASQQEGLVLVLVEESGKKK